ANLRLLPLGLLWNFALDGERARITDFIQLAEKTFHSDVAFVEGNLAAKRFSGTIRPDSILTMDAPDVATDFGERFDRLARAVEDHIGGIEVHPQVPSIDVVNELQESVRRFLSRLQMNRLPVPLAMVA